MRKGKEKIKKEKHRNIKKVWLLTVTFDKRSPFQLVCKLNHGVSWIFGSHSAKSKLNQSYLSRVLKTLTCKDRDIPVIIPEKYFLIVNFEAL